MRAFDLACRARGAIRTHSSSRERVRRRVALCRLLLSAPDLLLLDEPTNHLDAESVAWLEQHLAEYKGAIVAVTHDRYFLDNVAGWILELDRGRGIPFRGNYSSWLEQKQERLAAEEKQESARRRGNDDLVLHHLLAFRGGRQLLVLLNARFAFGLPRPRRHPHPLQLTLQRPLPR